jgi:hypothetical protein
MMYYLVRMRPYLPYRANGWFATDDPVDAARRHVDAHNATRFRNYLLVMRDQTGRRYSIADSRRFLKESEVKA